jgi:hypothetical protein
MIAGMYPVSVFLDPGVKHQDDTLREKLAYFAVWIPDQVRDDNTCFLSF